MTIVDAGLRKDLDLQVLSPVEQFGPLPEKSIWPSIYRLLGEQIRAHRSTIVFANNRRSVERITAVPQRRSERRPAPGAHHGSVALEVRQQTETGAEGGPAARRRGDGVAGAGHRHGRGRSGLPGRVAGQRRARRCSASAGPGTSSASRARAGSSPRRRPTCSNRPCWPARWPPAASRRSACRSTASTCSPSSSSPWRRWTTGTCRTSIALVRRAYPYRDLSPQAFETTLEMISGRYRLPPPTAGRGDEAAPAGGTLNALQPRVSWDRVHNRLLALPGSQQLALVNGGTIPDTGQYAAYTAQRRPHRRTRRGVHLRAPRRRHVPARHQRLAAGAHRGGPRARRAGGGAPAMVPFWRGESVGRSYDLGLAIGAFLRELRERLDSPDCLDWLQREYFLDADAARNLRYHVRRQLLATGCLPTDRTLLIEASRDQLGDWQVILLSPLGSRLHLALRLALESALRQRLGYQPQCLHHDDGILIRLTDTDEPILDLFDGLTPENVEGLILDELADSALFALRFRQNAARALLLPRGQPGKRAPLWLQRLRGRDLLRWPAAIPTSPSSPRRSASACTTISTCRACSNCSPTSATGQVEVRDAPGRDAVAVRRRAAVRLHRRVHVPVRRRRSRAGAARRAGSAAARTAGRAGAAGPPARPARGPPGGAPAARPGPAAAQRRRRWPSGCAAWATWRPASWKGRWPASWSELEAEGRARRDRAAGRAASRGAGCWPRKTELYRQAFGLAAADAGGGTAGGGGRRSWRRFLRHARPGRPGRRAGPLPVRAAAGRERQLEEWARARPGRASVPRPADGEPLQWSAPANLEQVQRGSLALLRREVVTCPPPQFADFVLRWQRVHPDDAAAAAEGLAEVLERLQGCRCRPSCGSRRCCRRACRAISRAGSTSGSPAASGVWVVPGTATTGLADRLPGRAIAARSCRRRPPPRPPPSTRPPSAVLRVPARPRGRRS